jgi:uncharacterized protein (TIGR03083 family)
MSGVPPSRLREPRNRVNRMDEDPDPPVFSPDDLKALSEVVVAAWQQGTERDWSVPAGTLGWSCRTTAEHVIDAALMPALNLASQRLNAYAPFDVLRFAPEPTAADLVDCLRATTTAAWAIIYTAAPEARAVIRRRPVVEVGKRDDFSARCALELALHAHDVCSGLGIPFDPPAELCARLREHTRHWPIIYGKWSELRSTDDPSRDLVDASGRVRQ